MTLRRYRNVCIIIIIFKKLKNYIRNWYNLVGIHVINLHYITLVI